MSMFKTENDAPSVQPLQKTAFVTALTYKDMAGQNRFVCVLRTLLAFNCFLSAAPFLAPVPSVSVLGPSFANPVCSEHDLRGTTVDQPGKLPLAWGKRSRGPPSLVLRSSGNASPSAEADFIPRDPIGRLTALDRSKISEEPDTEYYAAPRLVTHADDVWISQLNALYRERIPADAIILDLMSSHVSHLPSDATYARVDVHGMNEAELRQNPAVQATQGRCIVHDLNRDPSLSFCPPDATYDAVLCALGVQYLEEPERVFADVARVLKPSGVAIVSFSSNVFYDKALTGWIERGMRGRSRLVKDYLRAAGGFEIIEEIGASGADGVLGTLASLLPAAGDPFGAVVGMRSAEP